MVKLAPGDAVVCRIRDSKLVNLYDADWHHDKIFDIISVYDEGYFALVPSGFWLSDAIMITNSNASKFNINKKFIECNAIYLNEFKIHKVHSKLDGMACCKCSEFYNYAAANQEDGTLICYNCRMYPFYKSRLDRI